MRGKYFKLAFLLITPFFLFSFLVPIGPTFAVQFVECGQDCQDLSLEREINVNFTDVRSCDKDCNLPTIELANYQCQGSCQAPTVEFASIEKCGQDCYKLSGDEDKLIEQPVSNKNFSYIYQTEGYEIWREGDFYFQQINLNSKFDLDILNGPAAKGSSSFGHFGNPVLVYQRQSSSEIANFFDRGDFKEKELISTVNAGFFGYRNSNTAEMTFPSQIKSSRLDGYFNNESIPNGSKILEIYPDRAVIREVDRNNPYPETAPSMALVSFSPFYPISANRVTGRTMVGVKDTDGDGITETVIVLSTANAAQGTANLKMAEREVSDFIMFDGGGSSQLRYQNQQFIAGREVPQFLIVSKTKLNPVG